MFWNKLKGLEQSAWDEEFDRASTMNVAGTM